MILHSPEYDPEYRLLQGGGVKDMPFSRVYAVADASSGFVRFDEAHKL